jgi:hypothetical protein
MVEMLKNAIKTGITFIFSLSQIVLHVYYATFAYSMYNSVDDGKDNKISYSVHLPLLFFHGGGGSG